MSPDKNIFSILYVDDEEKALKYFSRLYSDEFNIMTAINAADAKQILAMHNDSIGILISDQRMPETKGVDLLGYARTEYPQIIRLLTTAYSDLGDAIDAVNTGEILRYIKKPWDADSLRIELRNTMDFFLLRRERDQLLHEKLNVKQRLVEVNRVRDLVLLCMGITHLRNPLCAIYAFLTKIPFTRKSELIQVEQLDEWGNVISELKVMMDMGRKIIHDTSIEDMYGFQSIEISELASDIGHQSNIKLRLNDNSNFTITANYILIKMMLMKLIEFLQINSDDNEIVLEASSADDGIVFSIYNEHAALNNITLLSCPVDLLLAFFICYHHGGQIDVNSNEHLKFIISLPDDPLSTTLKQPDSIQLGEIFNYFDFWD